MMSADTYETARVGILTIGPLVRTLSVTTTFNPSDYVPDAFNMAAETVAPGATAEETVLISGLGTGREPILRVSGSTAGRNAVFSVNGDTFSATQRRVKNGDTVTFRINASPTNSGLVTLVAETLDPSGAVAATNLWDVTARDPNAVDAFSFNWTHAEAPATRTSMTTNTVTLTGGAGFQKASFIARSGYLTGRDCLPAMQQGDMTMPLITSHQPNEGPRLVAPTAKRANGTSVSGNVWSCHLDAVDIGVNPGETVAVWSYPDGGILRGQIYDQYAVLCIGSTCAEVRHTWHPVGSPTDPRAADPFTIVARSGVEMGAADVASEPFTVRWSPQTAGLIPPNIPIRITGSGTPEYRINGGAWTSATGWVPSGATIEVRLDAAATPITQRTATLSVGTTTATYSVTTQHDLTPDGFALSAVTGAAPDTVITSTPITITGVSTSVPVSVSGAGSPQLSVDGGVTWVSSGTVANNGTVRVRLTSAAAYETERVATLDVGGLTAPFSVTTGPFSFAVAAKTQTARNALIVSDPVTLPVYMPASTVSVSGDGSPGYSLDGGAFTSAPGPISGGQALRVRLTSASEKDAERIATVTIGSATAPFSVRTAPPDACETGAIGSVCSDGAVYAGTVNGNRIYAAPASETGSYQFMTTNNASLGVTTQDGLANLWAMQIGGISNYPAAQACAARGEGWVLPSETEMAALRTNRASMPAGTFSYASAWYWTSTEHPTTSLITYAHTSYLSGTNTSYSTKTTSNRVHCIRYSREEPRPAITDPCAGSPSVGALCADGSVYAGLSGGKRIFFETRHSATVAWKTAATFTAGAASTGDAVQNRLAMELNGGLSAHPAQNVCAAKGVSSSGSAWYLPARSDLAVLTGAATQGAIAQMFNANATGFVTNALWSSTQSGTSAAQASYVQRTGSFIDTGTKTSTTTANVLCMRYEAPQTYQDPCAGSPAAGALCADGTVFAGSLDGRQIRIAPVSGTFANKTTSTLTVGAVSTDGLVNTNAMASAGIALHPAAQACRALGSAFYLPSIQEMRVIRASGATAGVTTQSVNHWTSSELLDGAATVRVWTSHPNGTTEGDLSKTSALNVLCVKNEVQRTLEDPCRSATPTIGALCNDGTVYYGTLSGRRLYTSQTDAGTFAIHSTTAANAATTSLTDGKANTDGMPGTAYAAANACRALGARWYLPSRDELALLADNANGLRIRQTFGSIGSYWSSTQSATTSQNWRVDLTGGTQAGTTKTTASPVRCIYSNVTAGF